MIFAHVTGGYFLGVKRHHTQLRDKLFTKNETFHLFCKKNKSDLKPLNFLFNTTTTEL